MRNAIYTGEWLTDAKKYFSKSQCPATQIAGDYLTGPANRQKALEAHIVELIEDYRNGYISNQRGIYEYLLDGQERHLNIRAFSPEMAQAAYERQKGICPKCGKHFEIGEMQADHITPWSKGGKTTADNCQMLCADCNRRKSNI